MTSPATRPAPDTAEVATVLRAAGIAVEPGEIRISVRDDRFAAFLPGDLIAWFASTGAGDERLRREGRVLELLARTCSFAVPRLLSSAGHWQLRQAVSGHVDPWQAYSRVQQDPGYARSVGNTLGTFLAEQHLNIPSGDLAGLVPEWPSWPPRLSTIARDLPQVVDDRRLLERALELVAEYERSEAAVAERVLTHGDLGFHNIAFAPDGSVAGIFDYDGAALTDRHHDFALMLFDTIEDGMLGGAVDAYLAAGGAAIDLSRVAMLNAATAVGFLADRVGSAPGERPAGRTLDEDLAWTRLALDRLG